MLLVKREKAKRDLRLHAEHLIHNWLRAWVRRKKGVGGGHYSVSQQTEESQLLRDTFRKRQLFRKAKLATMVTLEDCQADSKKFDGIFHATRYVFEAVTEVTTKVLEVTDGINDPPPPGSSSRLLGSSLELAPVISPSKGPGESFLVAKAMTTVEKNFNKNKKSLGSSRRLAVAKEIFKENEETLNIVEAEEHIRDTIQEERKRTEKALKEARNAVHQKDLASVLRNAAAALQRTASNESGRMKGSVDGMPPGSKLDSAISAAAEAEIFAANPSSWKKNRAELARAETRAVLMAAFFGVSGTVCAILQNEWVMQGNDPQSSTCHVFKIINTVCTGLCILTLFKTYSYYVLLSRLKRHLSHGKNFDPYVSLWVILSRWKFVSEVAVCIAHVPPGVTGQVSFMTFANVIVYSYEMLGACWNLLRIYLLWRPFQRWMVSDIPNRQNIAGIVNIKFESLFVIKRMVNSWNAFAYVAGAWTVTILFLGYLLRSAEVTTCQFEFSTHPDCHLASAHTWYIYGRQFEPHNDLVSWNAMWLIFVTSTTVGYGNTPV